MTVEEKLKILDKTAIKEIEKKFGENSYYLGKKKMANVPILCSTGSLSLDYALTIGGFPEGRIIEIGGQESSGKTTLTLLVIAECQRQEKVCAFLDAEQAFDPVYASKLGVDVEKLLILQPDTAEEGFEMAHQIIKSGVVSLLVIDSTNSMIPKRIFEGEVGDAAMGRAALLFSQELPKIRTECTNNKCTAIFISQIRSKIGVMFGSPDKIGVGESMKFYASIRIKTSKADLKKDSTGEEGQESVDVVMNVFKNKVGVPFKKAQFTLLTDTKNNSFGIDTIKEVIDYAVRFEIIKKAGSWYSYGEERLGQGSNGVKKYFESNLNIYEEIKNKIIEKFKEEIDKVSVVQGSFDSIIAEESKEESPKRKRTKKEDAISLETPVEEKTEESKEEPSVESKE